MENVKDDLMIGEGVSVTGSIFLLGTLYVYGGINGEVVANKIHVGKTGVVNGDVKVHNADISGDVNNGIQVKGNLIIRATGKVLGAISYQSIEIESGGMVNGILDQTSTELTLSVPLAGSAEGL
jgi:cytoskeletal protein CcmA (bactofilin family)